MIIHQEVAQLGNIKKLKNPRIFDLLNILTHFEDFLQQKYDMKPEWVQHEIMLNAFILVAYLCFHCGIFLKCN
jgi:hypothetical protein